MEYHLAPLKNISYWVFRALFPEISDSYLGMINLKSLLSQKQQVLDNIDTFPIPQQRQWIQVLTNNPREMVRLSRWLGEFSINYPQKANIHGININAGCPDLDVIAAGQGAALIKRTKRLVDLIKAFLGESESHPYHISIKMRLGLNAFELRYKRVVNFLEAIRQIDDERLSPTIIHFKDARQSSIENPHWEFLERILDVESPIIINGNIRNQDDIIKIQYGLSSNYLKDWNKLIQGIMIGRAAIKDPNCFKTFPLTHDCFKEDQWKITLWKNIKLHPPPNHFIQIMEQYHPSLFKEKQTSRTIS